MTRLAYVDKLRVGAAMAVVMIHVAAMNWTTTPPESADWQAMNVYSALSRWSVPVFFMISGALFLAPGRQDSPQRTWRNYVVRLLVMFVAWSAAYAAMSAVFQGVADPVFLLQHLWDGYYHLWYLLALAGVYLLIPLLQRIVAVPELARYFVILTGVASVTVPSLALVPVLGGLSGNLLERVGPYLAAGFPFYFVLGHLLHENAEALGRRSRLAVYVAGGIGVAITIAGTAWASLATGQPNGTLYGYLSIGIVLAAAAVFLLVRLQNPGVATTPRLAAVARWTLPIYLIHPAFVRVIQEFDITPGLLPSAIGVPVVWLVVLALSALTSALLVRIPFVNKWLV
ncbi:MAG: acyltransferase family protein [Propionibacteriaceae bacterium]|nr:acyltransferase family protein [Propionibacteriaceae bacterium]